MCTGTTIPRDTYTLPRGLNGCSAQRHMLYGWCSVDAVGAFNRQVSRQSVWVKTESQIPGRPPKFKTSTIPRATRRHNIERADMYRPNRMSYDVAYGRKESSNVYIYPAFIVLELWERGTHDRMYAVAICKSNMGSNLARCTKDCSESACDGRPAASVIIFCQKRDAGGSCGPWLLSTACVSACLRHHRW